MNSLQSRLPCQEERRVDGATTGEPDAHDGYHTKCAPDARPKRTNRIHLPQLYFRFTPPYSHEENELVHVVPPCASSRKQHVLAKLSSSRVCRVSPAASSSFVTSDKKAHRLLLVHAPSFTHLLSSSSLVFCFFIVVVLVIPSPPSSSVSVQHCCRGLIRHRRRHRRRAWPSWPAARRTTCRSWSCASARPPSTGSTRSRR